jgi:hypothetical protein
MSQTPIYTADEAAHFINSALENAGSPHRVTAIIDEDDLVIDTAIGGEVPSLVLRRTDFGHWFAESIVLIAGEHFTSIW